MDVTNNTTRGEVQMEFMRLKRLFDTRFLENHNETFLHPFYQSVFFETIILLDDLLQKIKPINRISFKDHIPADADLYGDNQNDITDLIRFFRNAICHINNDKRNFEKNVIFSFNLINEGRSHISINGKEPVVPPVLGDAAIEAGTKYLFIKAHLLRVYDELKAAYLTIPEFGLKSILEE